MRKLCSSVFTLVLVASCSSILHDSHPGIPLSGNSSAPGARGEVSTSHDDAGNTRVSIRVHHLAPPTEVVPSTTAYIAWIAPVDGANPQPPPDPAQGNDLQHPAPSVPQATGDQPINAGVIRVNGDLDGALDALTPRQQFQVTITPERDPLATRPTNPPVLTATVR